ncbi:hypothetical protein PZ739_18510 [Pseudomonas kermanshahensis]|uniref:hypothetical protein n=1 Tax=Pseudomonas kermanshahensis TaxID=2745482 RepID=UPI0012FD818F|nr:hypothetical protein [Pseudomonas kermanshahensis]WEL53821.1 hypothetical protein PZ739_18510 [Pseudomonas kermanshahensis]
MDSTSVRAHGQVLEVLAAVHRELRLWLRVSGFVEALEFDPNGDQRGDKHKADQLPNADIVSHAGDPD